MSKKGAALFIVLAAVLLVVIFAKIILSITANQGRFTHHQSSRIRAHYAAQAGMVYALEKLRIGNWTAGATTAKYACLYPKGVGAATNVCIDNATITNPDYPIPPFPWSNTTGFDDDIPYKIQITIHPKNDPQTISNTTRLEIKTDYTY